MAISSHADEALQPLLDRGERLLWAGQPAQGLRFQVCDLFRLPFGLAVAAFVVLWEVITFRPGTPIAFRLVGLPFLAAGFHLSVGRFFVDARRRSHTFYGITDRRLLIRTGASRPNLRTFSFAEDFAISLRERPDGTGTILFGPTPPLYGWLASSGCLTLGPPHPPLFDSIPEARQVYSILGGAQATAPHAEA